MKRKNPRAIAVLSAALLIAPLVSFGAAVTSTASGAATPTRILTCTQKLATKPATYTLSCADANAGWIDMAWSTWGATTATGRGTLRQNNCTPNCVSGKFLDYRATVTLSKVVMAKKYGALFSQATFHYRVGVKAKTEVFGLADS